MGFRPANKKQNMGKLFWTLMYKLTGWKVVGKLSETEKKCVMIVAPHTSLWDFPVGLGSRAILGFEAKYLAKKELFKNPIIGFLLKAIGGIPVDRGNKSNGIVDSVVKYFDDNEEFIVALTPEGTRKYVKRWKTGFYRIAKQANVPIVMVGFDFKRKVVEFMDPFYLTDDMDADLEHIQTYFRGITGRNPELGVK